MSEVTPTYGDTYGAFQITLPGSIRSKKNSRRPIIIGGKTCKRRIANIPSKSYVDWEKQAQLEACVYWKQKPLMCLVSVEVHVFYAGKQPDLSGCLESVGDCLEGIIWEDDKLIESWDGSRLHHDKKNPRTEITVRWG